MIDGFINVYKEQGYTSFDVVAKLRGILKQKKIGHTGTLDPMAEGVLLVCLGKATKLCDMITEKNKEYDCVMLLGKTSDTEDVSGKILTECDDIENEYSITEEMVTHAVMSFVGPYNQIPPMYSAIKVNGKKLYELARQGIEIEREPRPVEIISIDIIDVKLPRVTFKVKCSKGTYIRSLCRDIGEKLGCGAVMERLVRTEVKGYTIDTALKLDEIERIRDEERIEEYVEPLHKLLKDYPMMNVTKEFDKLLINGNKLDVSSFVENTIIKGTNVRVYNSAGDFVALYSYSEEKKQYVPFKMFL